MIYWAAEIWYIFAVFPQVCLKTRDSGYERQFFHFFEKVFRPFHKIQHKKLPMAPYLTLINARLH